MNSINPTLFRTTLVKGIVALSAAIAMAGCRPASDAASTPTPAPTSQATTAASTGVGTVSTDVGTVSTAVCGEIKNLHQVRDIYLASQPSAGDLAEAKTLGVKTVVNLRPDAETKDFNEANAVRAAGLAYVHIPFAGADDLTDAIFDRTREALKTADRPLLVHCASANRVGAVWIAYRVLDDHMELSQGVAEAHTIGLHTPALEAKAKAYVQAKQR